MEKENMQNMDRKKENYETPVVEIIRFETEDVITTSGGTEAGDVSFSLR